jgi:hypothetical protein
MPRTAGHDVDAKRCFVSAERFARAAYTLSAKFTLDADGPGALENARLLPSIAETPRGHFVFAAGRMQGDMGYVDGYVVMAALSLELYLKALAAVSGASIRGHELDRLFDALPWEVRKRANDLFLQQLRPPEVFEAIASKLREEILDFVWELPAVLSRSADAFVRFRYPHDTKWTSFVGFREARLALRAEILRIRPEWANLGDAGQGDQGKGR